MAILSYIFWPFKSLDITLPKLQQTKQIAVVSHGVNDNTNTWAKELSASIQSISPGSQVIPLDWHQHSQQVFTCAVNGKRIGHSLANTLAEIPELKDVTLIGHSCGAFVNLGICEQLKAVAPNIKVTTIYLDPVSVYGGIFWDYGLEAFGSCADVSYNYFDSDDGVPGSNEPLKYPQNFDVTKLKEQQGYSGTPHLWPVYYYLNLVNMDKTPKG